MNDFQDIIYIGEMTLPGTVGHILVLFSTFTAIVSAIYFFLSNHKNEIEKQKLFRAAKWVYIAHVLSLAGVGIILYYLIFSHRFEYNYVYRYSSVALQAKYIVACLWAGQEGSFWVWAILQGLSGMIVLMKAGTFRPQVMGIVSLSQFFLTSMLLGVRVMGLKIGSSPFALLREMPEYAGETFFSDPNYVEQIADGVGLNPLLENPWMVSHPPVLFLGYALFLIPYAFALTALWKKDYTGWIKPALPWVLAALIFLGAGILLGGRWAYESLTFGGFWAWDPVENASLVPWLVMAGALHLMLLALKRKQQLHAAFIFVFLGFLFVLYAAFLTRSGILAETSVHSFGADKKYFQLVLFMAVFFVLPLVWLVLNWKKIPQQESETMLSRDFFLLAGSIVLLLSAFQIIFATSIPVINAVLGSNMAPPDDPVTYYNGWQIPFALMIALLIGLSQFLNYGKNQAGVFFRRILFSLLISAGLTIIYAVFVPARFMNLLLLGFALFAVFASLDYLFRFARKMHNLPGAITHIGFGIFLAAVVITFTNEKTISKDPVTKAENIKLIKGQMTRLGEYHVVYSNRKAVVNETFYTLDFLKLNADSSYYLDFTLVPSINRHPQMGQVSNPATRHKLTRDIYTYVSHAHEVDFTDENGLSLLSREIIRLGDTIMAMRSMIIFDSLKVEMPGDEFERIALNARFQIISMMQPTEEVWVRYSIEGHTALFEDAFLEEQNMKLRFEGVGDKPHSIILGIYGVSEDHIVVHAVIFPFIRLLWLGTFIMLAGFLWALIRRIRAL